MKNRFPMDEDFEDDLTLEELDLLLESRRARLELLVRIGAPDPMIAHGTQLVADAELAVAEARRGLS